MKKRGQITIFIILAVAITAVAILIYMFYPEIKAGFGYGIENPNAFLQECLEEDVINAVKNLSLQGGSIAPENYFLFNDSKVEYLCFTNEYYVTCVMQRPMLKEHIEEEIKNAIKEKENECIDEMKKAFEKQGYEVSLRKGDFNVELLPKRISIEINTDFSIKKTELKEYKKFNLKYSNNLYELIAIAKSILNTEARYGDSETSIYMDIYRDLKVEKYKQSEGTTIYILTDRNTLDKFQFASRSIAWKGGI